MKACAICGHWACVWVDAATQLRWYCLPCWVWLRKNPCA